MGSRELIHDKQVDGIDIDLRTIFDTCNPDFICTCEILLKIKGHETNTTAALYRLLRNAGLSVPQVSLETYFSFAKKPGSTMHDRPDMVVFDENFDGMFNLYKKGDRSRSNDDHKLKYIKAIFEVKGSASMDSKGDKARLKSCLGDIDKLKRWQSIARVKLDGYFIYRDGSKKGLSKDAIQEMFDCSGKNTVIYISNAGIEVS